MIKKKLSRIEDFISPTCFSYQTNTFRYSYKLPFTPILYTKKHDNSFYFLYNIICTKLRFLRGAKLCDTPREVLNARVCVASRMPRECEASESLLMPCVARQANAVCKPSRSESLSHSRRLRKPNSRLPRIREASARYRTRGITKLRRFVSSQRIASLLTSLMPRECEASESLSHSRRLRKPSRMPRLPYVPRSRRVRHREASENLSHSRRLRKPSTRGAYKARRERGTLCQCVQSYALSVRTKLRFVSASRSESSVRQVGDATTMMLPKRSFACTESLQFSQRKQSKALYARYSMRRTPKGSLTTFRKIRLQKVTTIFFDSTDTTNYIIIRPLINCSRKSITITCRLSRLPVYPDLSNSKLRYSRNRIRKQIIPTLKFFLNPKIEKALFKFSENLE